MKLNWELKENEYSLEWRLFIQDDIELCIIKYTEKYSKNKYFCDLRGDNVICYNHNLKNISHSSFEDAEEYLLKYIKRINEMSSLILNEIQRYEIKMERT